MAITKLNSNQINLENAWTSWTPTFTGLVKGNAVITAYYRQLGKTVNFRLDVVFGNTSSFSDTFYISLPVTSVVYGGTGTTQPIGQAMMFNGTAFYAYVNWASTTTMSFPLAGVTGSNVQINFNTDTTHPFTWTTNNELHCSGTYEAA